MRGSLGLSFGLVSSGASPFAGGSSNDSLLRLMNVNRSFSSCHITPPSLTEAQYLMVPTLRMAYRSPHRGHLRKYREGIPGRCVA